ncbi:hypothetical protein PoB_006669100 [Plakobranchus ocellatus]|uniref:Uncharacterized protein n=1 Tax=Plakobranchus ocellatus TaxID=259542 RepID=A0AAV4D8C1_9GAST|nr:hypothetical protein PoB_006669100 [Plakobranchus ocellatus]
METIRSSLCIKHDYDQHNATARTCFSELYIIHVSQSLHTRQDSQTFLPDMILGASYCDCCERKCPRAPSALSEIEHFNPSRAREMMNGRRSVCFSFSPAVS